MCFLSSRVCLTETIFLRNATIVTRIGKGRTPSLAKHNANRAFTSIYIFIYLYIYIFIYLLASEASLSLVMSIELEIYFIYIFIYLYIYVRQHMDLRQNRKTNQQNDDVR